MPATTQIVSMRQRQRLRARNHPAGRLGLLLAGLLSLLLALVAIFGPLAYSNLTQNLPAIDEIPVLIEAPNGLLLQPTRLYDRDGQHVLLELQNPAARDRQYLRIEPVAETPQRPLPQDLINATLAASDPNFWQHPGFSMKGLFEGTHPTLAQHLVSDLLLEDEPPTLRRALRERLLATQLTQRYGREKVLEWYLNSANYGRLAYGADAAAKLYFDKPATDLNLAEAAMLAGVANDPELNPFDAPQSALERQKHVLEAMLRSRLASPQAAAEAAQQKLSFRPIERPGQALQISDLEPQIAPAFAQMALDQLEEYIPRSRLERGGLNILTTLDYGLQQQVRCAIVEQMARLGSPPSTNSTPEPDNCAAALLLPKLQIPQPITDLQANVVVLEPQTGQILALVDQLTNGTQTELLAHPTGSLGIPFIYLTAFTRGLSPASLVWDIPAQSGEPRWSNFDGKYRGPMRLRIALANDYLVPADKLLTQIGKGNIWRTAQQFGLSQPAGSGEGSSLTLFRPMNLVEISQAFGVLANQGILAGHAAGAQSGSQNGIVDQNQAPAMIQPATVSRVEDATGKIWLDRSTWQTRPIITPELAYLMTNVLSDETARWPSLGHPNPLEIGRPVATKIGRTLDNNSSWVIGYTPDQLIGVWMGQNEPPAGQPAEARAALPQAAAGLWHALTQYAHRNLPTQNWPVPKGVTNVKVCDPSGMLPTKDCPEIVEEVFLAGNEPIQADRLYRSAPVDRKSGRLATIYTPPDLVDQLPYLVVPPEAAEWAKQEGFATPPEVYDTLPSTIASSPDVNISSPQAFAILNGQTPISGSVTIKNLDFFRLQAGQGLNPQAWFQVGEDQTQMVKDGLLGKWDTSKLNGVYALQLIAVQEDQSVTRDTVLVTIDNLPPVIELGSPFQGEEISASERPSIVLWVEVSDDLEVARVEFYLDDQLLATFAQPPYGISWKCTPGEHTLRVRAIDSAGNSSEESVQYTVE
jgi:membrane peptidoglycan carboxypeptidase